MIILIRFFVFIMKFLPRTISPPWGYVYLNLIKLVAKLDTHPWHPPLFFFTCWRWPYPHRWSCFGRLFFCSLANQMSPHGWWLGLWAATEPVRGCVAWRDGLPPFNSYIMTSENSQGRTRMRIFEYFPKYILGGNKYRQRRYRSIFLISYCLVVQSNSMLVKKCSG